MFKQNWEKTSTLITLAPSTIDAMVEFIYPGAHITSLHILEGGCANLNIHMTLAGHSRPLLLRIYVRDPKSSHVEQSIEALLRPTLPIPQTYATGSIDGFQFAFKEFIEGISLRDLLLSEFPYDLKSIMYEVGRMLFQLSQHRFSQSGFFDEHLTVCQPFAPQFAKNLHVNLLEDPVVTQILDKKMHNRLQRITDRFTFDFASTTSPCLVHGDFDPANILVQKVEDTWRISALLDFEFAHAGSFLLDVATMLRYAHLMPPAYGGGFLEGLSAHGITLEADLTTSVSLLNCLALIEILARTDPQKSPNQIADIKSLLLFFLDSLDA
jgi:serine/threonine protein kinase